MIKKKKVIIISITLLIVVGGFVLCYDKYKKVKCRINLYMLCNNFYAYHLDCEDELIPADKWCDLFVQKQQLDMGHFICPNRKKSAEKISHYVMNENILLYRSYSLLPGDMVLFFEGAEGWNQIGGPDEMVPHKPGGLCTIILTGGDFKSMTIDEAKQLNWEQSQSDLFLQNFDDWDIENEKWTACEILTPEEQTDVSFMIRKGHPFLAEFERKIVLTRPDASETELSAGFDTGGRTQLKVFWFSDNDQKYLKLKDSEGSWWVIDFINEKTASSVVASGNNMFSMEHQKTIEFYDKIDWQYIGLIKYDRPDYEKNLTFEKGNHE